MKAAICFSGQARSIEYTYDNLRAFIDSNFENYDVFMHIKDDEHASKVEKYIRPSGLVVEKDPDIDESGVDFDSKSIGKLQTYLRMLWSRKRVNEIKNEYAQKNGIKYDCVVSSRIDVKYFSFHDVFIRLDYLNMENVYIPDFHCFPIVQGKGYNDRFAMSNERNMNLYFNFFNYVVQEKSFGHKTHGESSLYRYLNSFGYLKMKFIPVRFTRIREGGKPQEVHVGQAIRPDRLTDEEWQLVK